MAGSSGIGRGFTEGGWPRSGTGGGQKAAFGVTPAQAFAVFKARILVSGEAPDAFLAELRRLARIVCTDGDEDTVDQFVICQFVDGLPEPELSWGLWRVGESESWRQC